MVRIDIYFNDELLITNGKKMIKHIVMWKLKDVAEGKTKAENAETMKKLLEDLPSKINELKSAEVGVNMLEGNEDVICDVVLTVCCDSEEDLRVYTEHSDHQKVVSFIKKVVNERRVIDYVQ